MPNIDPKLLALLGAGSSMLQASGPSPVPTSFGQAMGQGLQGGLQGYQTGMNMQLQQQLAKQRQAEADMAQQELQRKLQSRIKLENLVQSMGSNSSPSQISNAIASTGDPDLIGYAKEYRGLGPKVKSTIKGYDESGNPVFHNVMDTGEVNATSIRPAEKMAFQNIGQETLGIDPFTGEKRLSLQNSMAPGEQARLAQSAQQFGASHGLAQQNSALQQLKMQMEMDPEYQARKAAMMAGAKAQATNQVKAESELPRVITQGEDTIRLVDELVNHPGFSVSVGKSAPIGSIKSMIPGTDASSFNIALEQLQGKQFLEAFETLKGGGQITEIEGKKATQAMSRMNKANTEEEFKRAAREFQDVIRSGINRAKQKAGVSPSMPQQQQSSDGWGELR